MDPFLDRFYDEVDDNLADPHSQRRLTNAQRYRDLHTVQVDLFERLLNATGQESLVGRTQATITLVSGQDYYELPPGFRHFVSLQKLVNNDPDYVEDELNTIPTYASRRGIQIFTQQRGFKVHPVPTSQSAGDWVMTYLKGPVLLHYATTTRTTNPPDAWVINALTYALSVPVAGTHRITRAGFFTAALEGETIEFASPINGTATVEGASRTITAANADYIEFDTVTGLADLDTFTVDVDWCWLITGTPATDAGEKVFLPDYYNGSLLRIYDAADDEGVRQTKEILDYYKDADDEWHVILRHPWTLEPTTAKYEICPELPEAYDSIYAMDVAIRNTGRRTHLRRRAGLLEDRRNLWNACLNWAIQNTMDRAPERTIPENWDQVDPYSIGIA